MDFVVATYNYFLIPYIAGRYAQTERVRQLSSSIQKLEKEIDKQIDVIAFQELFATIHYDKIKKDLAELGFIYSTNRYPASYLIFNDCGVVIFSRWPLVNENFMCYKDWNLAEFFTYKGVVTATVQCPKIPNGEIQVYATHLQARDTKKAKQARLAQLIELNDFKERTLQQGKPAILVGDLNLSDNLDVVTKLLDQTINGRALIPINKPVFGEVETKSWNRDTNHLSRYFEPDGISGLLDYVVILENDNAPTPISSTCFVAPIKSSEPIKFCSQSLALGNYVAPTSMFCLQEMETFDLSDHYPVVAILNYL